MKFSLRVDCCEIFIPLTLSLQSINVIEGGDASFSRRKLQLRTKLETVMAECESKIKTLQLYESKLKTIESGKSGTYHGCVYAFKIEMKIVWLCTKTLQIPRQKEMHQLLPIAVEISYLRNTELSQFITDSYKMSVTKCQLHTLLLLYNTRLKLPLDMTGLEQWINTSCDTLSGNLGANSTLLESVKLLDSEISVQKTHLVVSFNKTSCLLPLETRLL